MGRALVVGGSGMLATLSTRLATDGGMTVGVIARTRDSLERMGSVSPGKVGRLIPMALDYHDLTRLRHWVAHFQLMEGPLDLVVAWIHEPVEPVLSAIISEVEAYRHMPWHLVEVVGSRGGVQPGSPVPRGTWCLSQRVVLGFMVESGFSRWLSHEEISQGVFEAIQSGQLQSMVGTLEPWDEHP